MSGDIFDLSGRTAVVIGGYLRPWQSYGGSDWREPGLDVVATSRREDEVSALRTS